MARQRTAVQINQFVGGMNTEANPLSYPPNFSREENNMEFLADGSRERRKGFDVGYAEDETVTIAVNSSLVLGRSQYLWLDPGGQIGEKVMVVQVGNHLSLHQFAPTGSTGVSDTPTTYTLGTGLYSKTFSYADVDGVLVIATGEKEITVIEYDGAAFTKTTRTLLIRDLIGVEASDGTDTLTDPLNLAIRPATLSDEHLYNLRNQGFGLPRVEGDADTLNVRDPIAEFYSNSGSTVYPSNADNITQYLLADSNMTTNRTIERFNATTMFKTPPDTGISPRGHFIIDALQRGTSRLAQVAALEATYASTIGTLAVTTLIDDETSDGPTVVGNYSGRVWYGGFSTDITDGDGLSPRMGSYILFSQIVDSPNRLHLCFQEADPTSNIDPDVVETDGGFIKVSGARNIKALVPLGAALFVLAENGVWQISGEDRNAFTATSFSVTKISASGCINGQSAVVTNDSLIYWSADGIFIIGQNELGDWRAVNASEETVQTLYENIPLSDRKSACGFYDRFSKSVRWIYGTNVYSPSQSYELVFNTKYTAFTLNKINTVGNAVGPITATSDRETNVFDIGGSDYEYNPIESHYCIIIDNTTNFTITFGGYHGSPATADGIVRDDWTSEGAVDSEAFILTGPLNTSENRLRKEVPYLSTYFKRSNEDSLLSNEDSSCLVQARWGWTDDSLSGKWTTQREAYRVLRSNEGETMVVTRNSIRGSGKSVAFRFSSSPGKAMRLYGWEFNLQAGEEE
jgi:hypothetical protein